MHPDVGKRLELCGWVTRPELLANGFDDKAIGAWLKSKALVRIGPGLYADYARWHQLTREQRHVLWARAANTRFAKGTVVFSHHTAALLLGAAVWGVDLANLQLTRNDGGSARHEAGIRHHVGALTPAEIVEVDGILVTSPARTAWDMAIIEPQEQAIVTADSILNLHLAERRDYKQMADDHWAWRRARHARLVLGGADEQAESPGESRCRVMFGEYDIPKPISQYKIYNHDGILIARADWGWPEYRHLGEFDGMIKYRSVADLTKEKAREDEVRALMWGMSRLIWAQLDGYQRRLAAKDLREALERSRRLYGAAA